MKYRPDRLADALYAALADTADLQARAAAAAKWLHRKGLLALADEILAELPAAARRAKGRELVHISSAGPLADADLQALVTAAGGDPDRSDIAHRVDPSLLAGAKVRRPSIELDLTLTGKTDRLRHTS